MYRNLIAAFIIVGSLYQTCFAGFYPASVKAVGDEVVAVLSQRSFDEVDAFFVSLMKREALYSTAEPETDPVIARHARLVSSLKYYLLFEKGFLPTFLERYTNEKLGFKLLLPTVTDRNTGNKVPVEVIEGENHAYVRTRETPYDSHEVMWKIYVFDVNNKNAVASILTAHLKQEYNYPCTVKVVGFEQDMRTHTQEYKIPQLESLPNGECYITGRALYSEKVHKLARREIGQDRIFSFNTARVSGTEDTFDVPVIMLDDIVSKSFEFIQ